MGPLVRVTYSNLTQSVFRLDRVNSSCCGCPANIPVAFDSNASCFNCFSSGSSSPEVAEFCPTLLLVYFIARASASTCALSSVYSLPCNNFVQKVVPQVKNSVSLLRLLRTCTCPWFFFRKNSPIFIPQAAHPALGMCFHVGFEVYSSTLRLLP
jgi:hypothetical protein